MASASAYAVAPVITDPPDVIIGDLEQGAGNNIFVFPDALDLDALVVDDNTADSAIKWSYITSDPRIVINGAAPLSGGDPNAPLAGENLRGTDTDTTEAANDGAANTITFRNAQLSPVGGPTTDPGVNGIVTSQTTTITLFASDCSTYSQTDVVVYTSNDTSDSLSGGSQLTNIIDLDFENNPNDRSGWFGAVLGGMGSTSIATGLCMSVPFGADAGSIVGWVSPPNIAPGPNFIQLVDKGLYRSTLTLYTNTTVDSGIPYVDWVWNNFLMSASDGNTYGGLYWLLDVAGGATGIGRYQNDFNVWITPNSALTDQWRGVVDAANSAFDPSVDFKNDFSFTLRILHDNASLNTAGDGGTICLRRLRVDRTSLDSVSYTPIQTNPIQAYNAGGIFFRDPDDFGTASAGTFQITGGVCNLALTPNPSAAGAQGLGARKKLLYFDQTQPAGNRQFYPTQWTRGTLYATRVKIRSNVGGAGGTVEGTDPVDTIFVDFSVPQSEVGSFHFTDKGSVGNMLRAASPRLLATTGKATGETYIGFFEGPEASHANALGGSFLDSDRIRGYIDFFNTGAIIGTISDGLDAVTVESVEVDTVTY